MNIVNIRTTLMALELGSFSAAGSQLGVPVSTVSRRVKELETELGRRLVVRGGRGVRPVEEAHDTLLKLRDAMLAFDDCYAEESSMTRIRVTSTLEMAVSLLPKAIPGFNKKFPDVVIELLGEDRKTGLIEADFDLAIRTGALDDLNLIAKPLAMGGFVLVASPKLAARLTSVQDLASVPMLEVSGPGPGLSGHFNGEPFELNPPVLARLNSFTASIPCLLAGSAYGQVPQHVVRKHLDSGELVKVPRVKLPELPIHALYPKRHRNESIMKAFIAELEALFSAEKFKSLDAQSS